jgi:hypothetical protein
MTVHGYIGMVRNTVVVPWCILESASDATVNTMMRLLTVI